MAGINELWATYLNCAGLVVVGLGFVLLALAATSTCIGAILCAGQPKRIRKYNQGPVDSMRMVTGL